ncbi:uncharacterized protein [Hyperolius riggenbachi]|uniref:uncharacterized protein isoform X2 n=1 Tax=Hyperolius riggenbachi TaxID=752182 RepID=UPI0035A26461
MAAPLCTLCLLLAALTGACALKVTIKNSVVTSLRGQKVILSCNIIDLDTTAAIAVAWFKKMETGTEKDVYAYDNGNTKVFRKGSYIVEREILKGVADLHIPNVQFSDDGEYVCSVLNTPNAASGKVTLQVSAQPSVTVIPGHVTIEEDAEKSVTCDVTNVYPQTVTIRWVRYSQSPPGCKALEKGTCTADPITNPDGTFNITSHLTLNPTKEDDGSAYGCVVTHRSIDDKIARNFTLTVTEREDNTGTIVGAMVGTLICTLGLVACVLIYWMRFTKDRPTLSAITGNYKLTDMCRTTLTCQIMNYRPNDITVSVCLRRPGQQEVTIYTCRPRLTRDGDQVILDVEEQPMLVNGAARQDKRPLQLEVDSVVIRSKLGSFSCQCSLRITPSYDLDNGAELSIYVTHPALTSPISVRRTLSVIGVPPRLLKILFPKYIIHDEPVTLTCPINGFKPRSLSITWWKRDRRGQETELITWDSGEYATHNPKYSHDVSENERDDDKSYSYLSALTMRPDLRNEDGATYICRTFHPATQEKSEEEMTMNVTAVPVLDAILKGQESVCVGEKMYLSCKIHSFHPKPIKIAWYIEEDENTVSIPSVASEPLQEPSSGVYHVTTTISYIPTLKDLNKVFRCEVKHDSLARPKYVTWTLTELVSMPCVGEIQSAPAVSEIGRPVKLSCTASDMYPNIQTVQWNRNKVKLESEKWSANFQPNPESGMFSGTTELTLTPTAADHGALISLDVMHSGRAIKREFTMLLKGFPVVGEITSDPRIAEYGRTLTLLCHVIGCDLRDITRVTWADGGGQAVRGQQKETRGTGESLACTLMITPTAEDYGRVYTCSAQHKTMIQPITRTICLKLPEKPPTLSDVTVRPVRVRANQEASLQVLVSGFSPRDIQVKWYKGFSQFPSTAVTSSEPRVGEDNLYALTSTLTFTPSLKDDKVSMRCEVTHSASRTIREKHYVLNLTGQSDGKDVTAPGPGDVFLSHQHKVCFQQ